MQYNIVFLILFTTLNCNAQTVVNINEADNYGSAGFYYKDTENDFNTFIGTWEYTDGNNSLIISFQKKENKHDFSEISDYYYDA